MTSGIFRSANRSGILDGVVVKYRNRVAAEKAWHCRKAGFGAQASNDVFKEGFIDGYIAIAEGDDGCTPLVAPQKYWGWQYQSVAGQNAAGSWFGGYPLGVQAAEEDGLGTFRKLPFCDRPGVQGPGCNQCGPGLPGYIDPISDGYDVEGYDADGYDRRGYDRDGYDVDGRLRSDADPNDLERDRLGSGLDRDRDGLPDARRRDPSLNRDGNPRTGTGRVPIDQIDGPAIETDADDLPGGSFDSAPPAPRRERSPFEDSIDNGMLDLSDKNFGPAQPSRSSTGTAPVQDAWPTNDFDLGGDFETRYTPQKLTPDAEIATKQMQTALNAPAGPVSIEAADLPAKLSMVGTESSAATIDPSPADVPVVSLDSPRIATRPPAMTLPSVSQAGKAPTAARPSSTGVSTSLSDSTFDNKGVTIEQIFGIPDDDGSGVQLDDLPFSFE